MLLLAHNFGTIYVVGDVLSYYVDYSVNGGAAMSFENVENVALGYDYLNTISMQI